jgi:hypothetical protein
MTLSARVKAVFKRAWIAYGKPTLMAAPPVADWSLPAGFSYDASLDAIVDASGTVLPNPEDYWGALNTVYIVPVRSSDDLRSMIAAGIVPDGLLEVFVLAADLATVRTAHAVQVNGQWYDVAGVAAEPSGTSDVWARLRLTRRS